MVKKILSVGLILPGDVAEFVPLDSTRSLLDADILLLRPSVTPFFNLDYPHTHYQGKPNLNDHASFRLKSAANHWKQQIQMAVGAGKIVFLFLPDRVDVFVATGQQTASGTGRNRVTTRHVAPFSNYDMVPTFADKISSAEGQQMKLTENGKILANYWAKFGASSSYNVFFEELHCKPLLTTATGNYAVGCTFTFKGSKGGVVALPPITDYDLDPEDLEGVEWDAAEKAIGHQIRDELLAIASSFASHSGTPPPVWANADDFTFARERELNTALIETDSAIEVALARKTELSAAVAKEGTLRSLLFEQGKPLELAILEALVLLGFAAEPFADGESEFDAVFVSPEGRFIGEAEGKDTKAVNIDKLRQLEMNIQEDLAREDVSQPAKGVLFGNAFRFQPLAERPPQYFTDKCLSAAKRSQTALVRTPDLFLAAKYVKESGDKAYADACRTALLEQGGSVVTFPAIPPTQPTQVTDDAKS